MIKKISTSTNWILFLIPIFISGLLYYKSITYYFFQDDFYEILLSKASSFKEVLSLFTFLENRSSYRPIGLQLYFFASQKLFALNPVYYRVVTLMFFFGSYFLIYKCVSKIFKNKLTGQLTSFFWVTSSIHFLSISWIAAAWIEIGTFFFFLSLLFFLKYFEKNNLTYYLLAFLSFLICAGAFEFFLALPFVVGAYLFIFAKKNVVKILRIVGPLITIVFIYALARFQFASLPQINEYKLEVGGETFKNLLWYVLWTLNIPEEFKKQVITNILVFNKTFVSEFSGILLQSFASMASVVGVGIISLYKSRSDHNSKTLKMLIYCVIWFLVSISPVVFFPNHSFAMYLVLPSVGIYMAIAYALSLSKSKYLITLAICVWLFSSFATLKFYRQIFWVVDSQEFARNFNQQIKAQFPSLPKNSVIYYPLEDKRHRQAILNGDATKVIYGDSSIVTYFDKSSLENAISSGKIDKNDVKIFYEK